MITYSAAGVALDDSSGRWSLLRSSLIAPAVAVQSVDTMIPGMDGGQPVAFEALQTGTMSWRLSVDATSDWGLSKNLAALGAALRSNGSPVVIGRTTDTGHYQSTTGKLASISEPTFSPSRHSASITVVMKLPDVLWRGPSADWSKSNAVSGTAYQVSTLDNSNAPVSDGLILIGGPCSDPTVTDVVTGAWAKLTLTLTGSQKALIDCGRWLVRSGSGVSFTGGGSITTGSLSTSGGPYLLRITPAMAGTDPATTAAKLKLSGSGFTSATSLSVRARPAYLM